MNLHTDIPKDLHDILDLKGFYLDALQDWLPYMDFVSFDAYPNMYIAQPILADLVSDRLQQIRKIVGNSTKIIIMETGYPVEHNSSGLPTSFNFSEENQALYVSKVVQR